MEGNYILSIDEYLEALANYVRDYDPDGLGPLNEDQKAQALLDFVIEKENIIIQEKEDVYVNVQSLSNSLIKVTLSRQPLQ